MELLQMFQNRRSVRQYTDAPIPEETLTKILQAGLLSASGKAIRPWEFIVVRDRKTLDRLTDCRSVAMPMFRGAACAIVVVGDPEQSDVWVEDCSAAMAQMHLMADALGLGSCWVQGRLREAADGRASEAFVRDLLGIPERFRLEAILTLGPIDRHPEPHDLDRLPAEKIHYETF